MVLHKSLPHHPQVREHKQGEELRRVLGQASVANFGVTKLALDNPKRVLNLGTDAGFELFDLVQYGTHRALFIQCPTFARSHCNMPAGLDVLDFFALGYALTTSVGINISLIPMYECVGLGWHHNSVGDAAPMC